MSIRLVFFLAHWALKRRFSSQNNPEYGEKVFKHLSPIQTRETACSTPCLVSCQSDLVSDALVISPPLSRQFCLPLDLSSQDYICTSCQLLGITLACSRFPVRRPKFYHLTPYGFCASLSLSRFPWWCAPKKHLFRILDAVFSLLNETFLCGDRHCLSRWQTIMTVNNIYLVLSCARHLLITLQVLPG